MALFKLSWLRRLVRRNTSPIPYDRAARWKERLSLGYMLLAWNAFGMVCYMVYTGRSDWARYYGYKSEEEAVLSPATQFIKQLNMSKAKVVQFSGLTKTGEFEVDNTDADAAVVITEQQSS